MAEPQAKSAETAAKKTTDDISRDLDALRGDVSRLAETVRTLIGEEADTMRSRLNERAEDMAKQGRAYRDAAYDEFRSYEAEAEATIHRNPFTAVLVALGLGLFLGFLSRR